MCPIPVGTEYTLVNHKKKKMKTLYLGPKVNLSLPFVLSQTRTLIISVVAILFSLASFSQELVFKNPQLASGNDKADGAVYRFSNVAPNIDALLRITGRSDQKVKLKDPDFSASGFDKAFQPRV